MNTCTHTPPYPPSQAHEQTTYTHTRPHKHTNRLHTHFLTYTWSVMNTACFEWIEVAPQLRNRAAKTRGIRHRGNNSVCLLDYSCGQMIPITPSTSKVALSCWQRDSFLKRALFFTKSIYPRTRLCSATQERLTEEWKDMSVSLKTEQHSSLYFRFLLCRVCEAGGHKLNSLGLITMCSRYWKHLRALELGFIETQIPLIKAYELLFIKYLRSLSAELQLGHWK